MTGAGTSRRCRADDISGSRRTPTILSAHGSSSPRTDQASVAADVEDEPIGGPSTGFVRGHWTIDRHTSESFVLLTYDSITAAEAMAENIRGNADNQRHVGLGLVDVRILEVSASA